MSFLGQEEQVRELQDRFRYVTPILFLGLGLLASRLVLLQVIRGDTMRKAAEENRIKRVEIPAPRGMIFDRNGTLLVDNRPAFDLEIIPQYLKESGQTKEVIHKISELINMPEDEIHKKLEKAKYQPTFMPIKIKTDLDRDEVAKLETWKIAMPGVSVEMEIKRTNVFGDIASHLLGYIGEVTGTDLPALSKKRHPYKLGDSIGKFGIEKELEDELRGLDGENLVEVDALGRRIRDAKQGRVLAKGKETPAVPGHNMTLTIDQDLQLAAAKAFGNKAGGLVAINPKTGEILAMVSRPSFDPTEFSRGVSAALWKSLLDNENRPLRDKNIQDHYAPGSTFKALTAIAGLEDGVINEQTHFHCPGAIRVGNRIYHCHKKQGHGDMNVVTALTQSCDVFFFRVAQKLKSVDDLSKWAFRLGLGAKTGIPLAREVPGLIPTEGWKQTRFHQPWNVGETLSVAIGQSFVLTSPIQLANLYATIANGGTLYRPYFVKSVQNVDGHVMKNFSPQVIAKTQLHPKTVELLRRGLLGVVNQPTGTAFSQRIPGVDFAGKTGTSQVIRIAADKIYQKCENLKYRQRHHALFAGFAPAEDPVIAVGVVAEHACHGASGAAPVARAVIKAYLEKYWPDIYGEKNLAARIKAKGEPLHLPARGTAEDEEDVVPDLPSVPSAPGTQTQESETMPRPEAEE